MPDCKDTHTISDFHELVGFRLIEWEAGYAVLELEIAPYHLNRSKVLHGGVLTE